MPLTRIQSDALAGAITSSNIADGTIATADLANNSVTTAKIAEGAVVTADLANGAVTAPKVAAGTVENYMASSGANFMFRNKIINGDMRFDQRNGGSSVTITTDPQYTVDRWKVGAITGSRVSVARSTAAPAGFTNSVLITSLAATSVGANDYYGVQQDIEGFNISDLAWGTASAAPITVSFWVRSSMTGTFSIAIRNSDQNRSYPTTYTISQANTWEYKTVTIPGDTTGTWGTGNGVGIRLTFSLGNGTNFQSTANTWAAANRIAATGTVALVSTNGATMNITGVQVEKGSVATPFENRPYGLELSLCQRYCLTSKAGNVQKGTILSVNSNYVWMPVNNGVPLRTRPTVSLTEMRTRYMASGDSDPAGVAYPSATASDHGYYLSANSENWITTDLFFFTGGVSLTQTNGYIWATYTLSAEL